MTLKLHSPLTPEDVVWQPAGHWGSIVVAPYIQLELACNDFQSRVKARQVINSVKPFRMNTPLGPNNPFDMHEWWEVRCTYIYMPQRLRKKCYAPDASWEYINKVADYLRRLKR